MPDTVFLVAALLFAASAFAAGRLSASRVAQRAAARVRAATEAQRTADAQFRTLADSMPQIVWSTRGDGYHDYFNERWYEYTGMPRPDEPGGEYDPAGTGQGWNWKDYLHPDDFDRTVEVWTGCLATGDPYHVEYRFKGSDGQYRWFIGRALPMRDAGQRITRWFGTCTDIDEHVRARADREVLLASERAARAEAERAVRLKDDFVATLSHELRTPLNAILGWTTILQARKDPANIGRGLEVIERNARAQARLIEDLLDVSRILSGKMRLEVEREDLAHVVDAAIASVQPSAEAKGVRIEVQSVAAVVRGDKDRLQQVVWNLLANAIKFSDGGGTVHVALTKQRGRCALEVRDEGCGIDPVFLPFIFDRFRQADGSIGRAHGGLGLGLAIVKAVVELHGGTIAATSDGPGKGARFVAQFPLAPALRSRRVAVTGDTVPDVEGLRVLVVDDEPDAREIVQRLLAQRGVHVWTVDSAMAAIEALSREPFDVMLSDVSMPEVDGYELIRRVRTLPGAERDIPAAALTALARPDDRTRALMAGFHMHLSKPVDPGELVATLASLAHRAPGPGERGSA